MFAEGVMQPIVKTRSIDDVPMLGLIALEWKMRWFPVTSNSRRVTGNEKVKTLRLKEIGGRTHELKVVLDKDKMAENRVDALSIMQMIQANNGSSNQVVLCKMMRNI